MIVLDIRDVLSRCALCPGICVTSCPVYRSTKVRAFAPNNLARIALRILNGKDEYSESLWGCTLCGACTDNCPLETPLGEALRYMRALSTIDVETTRITPTYIKGPPSGSQVLFLTRRPPSDQVINRLVQNYTVYWLNTDALYSIYYSGLTPKVDLGGYHVIIHEDYDAVVSLSKDDKTRLMHSTEFIHLKRITLTLDYPYILHIPCKARGSVNEDIIKDVLGEPSGIIKACLGGGGGFPEKFPSESLEVPKSILRGREESVIVTLCERTRDLLVRSGYRAYTPLDLLAGVY